MKNLCLFLLITFGFTKTQSMEAVNRGSQHNHLEEKAIWIVFQNDLDKDINVKVNAKTCAADHQTQKLLCELSNAPKNQLSIYNVKCNVDTLTKKGLSFTIDCEILDNSSCKTYYSFSPCHNTPRMCNMFNFYHEAPRISIKTVGALRYQLLRPINVQKVAWSNSKVMITSYFNAFYQIYRLIKIPDDENIFQKQLVQDANDHIIEKLRELFNIHIQCVTCDA